VRGICSTADIVKLSRVLLAQTLVDPVMKYTSFVAVAISLFSFAGQVSAQEYGCYNGQCNNSYCNHGPLYSCDAVYHENCMWPAQYIPTARCSVNNAYTAMINNGWRRQNLLGDYHFEEGSNQLTTAGKLKTKWILTQAPQNRRMIFVERGVDQSETASRIAAIHSWASNQSPVMEPVQVNDTHIVSEGHTAGSVDSIFVGFQNNQPAPVLQPSAASAGDLPN
jgi:hypothetical protein